MKTLSLFDGISCARVAIERAGIPVEAYYASEIDKYAIQISQKNYPDIVHIGDVKQVATAFVEVYSDDPASTAQYHKLPVIGGKYRDKIDLLIGGSPCQDLSIAKKDRKGLSGERSGLFYEYVRILNEVKPKYFILENVNSMPKEARETITKELFGIEPVMINASLVSAQNRKRLFWVGKWNPTILKYQKVEIPQPEDRGILLKDILEDGSCDRLKSYCIDANYFKGGKIGGTHQSSTRNYTIRIGQFNSGGQGDRVYSPDGKSVGLSALGGGRGAKTGLYAITSSGTFSNRKIARNPDKAYCLAANPSSDQTPRIEENMQIRKLTPIECERLQGLPDNYTEGVSNTQRYKALGNAFNVDVVTHILKHLK